MCVMRRECKKYSATATYWSVASRRDCILIEGIADLEMENTNQNYSALDIRSAD